jgi:hypothetical protein
MKTLFIAIALMSVAAPAFADVPPTPSRAVATATIEGEAAAALFEAINAPAVVEASNRMGTTSVKVERAVNGMAEVVCFSTVNHFAPRVTCTTTRSTNGEEVPHHISHFHNG